MSRVFLASCNTRRYPHAAYPLGMAAVGAALRGAGHETRCFDWLVSGLDEQALTRAVTETAPDVLMLSVRNLGYESNVDDSGDSDTLGQARRVVAGMRSVCDAPLIIGGSAVSIRPDQLREALGADCAVVGEGERAAVELVRRIASGRPLPKVYRSDEVLDGGAIGPAEIDTDIASYYLNDSGILGVQTKRGCPFHCAYCPYPSLEGRRYRCRPPGQVVEDLRRLQKDFAVEMFFFVDAVFNDAGGHFRLLAEEIIRRELDVCWSAFFTPLDLTDDDIRLCRRAGLAAVELGTDASCDTTLSGLDKPFDWAQVHAVQQSLANHRVPTAHYVVFGGPGETRDTVGESLRNIEGLPGGIVFGFVGIDVLPGTPLATRLVASGEVDAARLASGAPVFYTTPHAEPDWIRQTLTTTWAGRADRVFPPQNAEQIVERLRCGGFKGLLWDRLVGFGQRTRS